MTDLSNAPIRHGAVVVFDMDLRQAWHGKSTLSSAMITHGWWKRLMEYYISNSD
jgi:hypothetical protein